MKNTVMSIMLSSALLLTASGCGSAPDYYAAGGRAYEEGDFKKAIKLFTKAAKTSKNPGIFINRGNCHSSLGNLKAAIADYDTAMKLIRKTVKDPKDPWLASLYYNRGFAYALANKYKLAIVEYEKTIAADGTYPDVKNALAWILATCVQSELRNPKRAVTLAESACKRSNWKQPHELDTLAAAHAAAGNFPEAVKRQDQAVTLCEGEEMKTNYRQRLELYRHESPYVDVDEQN